MRRLVSTFSNAAVDLRTGDVGVAVASKFLAAGAVVPWASANAGAVATQSFANTSYGPRGLVMMRDGATAAQALASLIASDDDAGRRQVGIVDARGVAAAHTGADCLPWAGHSIGSSYAAQGNLLVSGETVAAMAKTFETTDGSLGKRLLASLAPAKLLGATAVAANQLRFSSRVRAAAILASATS